MISYCLTKEEAKSDIVKLLQAKELPLHEHYPILTELIEKARNAQDPYLFIGKAISDMESQFGEIVYREDLYEYLIAIGCGQNEALHHSENIRKGMFKKCKIPREFPAEFCAWANGVRYLPSRSFYREEFPEFLL